MKKIAKRIATALLVTLPMLYPVYPALVQKSISMTWPNASTHQEAYSILSQEKKKLDIDEPITLRIYENDELKEVNVNAYSALKKSGGYVIGINKSSLDRIILRHELTHIKNGDYKSIKGKQVYAGDSKEEDIAILKEQRESGDFPLASYCYYMEPIADFYSFSGIRISGINSLAEKIKHHKGEK